MDYTCIKWQNESLYTS